ncbi:hypothetical protein [Sphaerisporangium perillae]|uniref:hypothetical protein n=1 Tax=Sphaerisporangium perillae TaxID=2935860 RepID=UPI00200C5CAC|nr:hypothetical protein [Sphaerisporangium perillae]
MAANLRAYIAHGLALHIAILPAFASLIHQPRVLTRFQELSNPMAGGRGLRDDLADYLRAEQRAGRLSPGAAVDAAATMIIGACHELVLPRLFTGALVTREQIPDDFIHDLVSTVMDGIGPPTSAS